MKIDWATLLGLVLAVGGISAGLVIEGGSVLEILQPTAALIVIGGTVGATLVAQPMGTVLGALRQVCRLFVEPRYDARPVVEQIVELAQKARRLGIVSPRISILALVRSQDTPPLLRIPRLFALNPAHHLRR